MSSLSDLKEEFRRAKVDFRWRDFVRLLGMLGYEQAKPGRTGGSRRTFFHPLTNHVIKDHEPHDGRMYRAQIKRLKAALESEGLL